MHRFRGRWRWVSVTAALLSEVVMLTRRRLNLIALSCTVALSACASAGGGGRTDGSVITVEEIDLLGPGVSAYEAIERLRPTWLRDRGVNSMSPGAAGDTRPRVHIDTTPYSLEDLRSFRGTDVQTIRFMDARDATTRYGTGYVNGLIVVTTRNSRGPGL
jgi:hypothetical protein